MRFLAFVFILITWLTSQHDCEKMPDGALVSVYFTSEVGFYLEEYPIENNVRRDVESYIINNVSDNEWRLRAEKQVFMTVNQLIYRSMYRPNKRQLVLPPHQVWDITFTEPPTKRSIMGRAYISRKYSFYSVLVGSASSVSDSEPRLSKINSRFNDYWLLPVDPYGFFQRTKYACINQMSFSEDKVFSENAWAYYDYTCKVEPFIPPDKRTADYSNSTMCHWTVFPNETCVQALRKIGYLRINILWTRIAWSESIASKYRFGEQTSEYADLTGVEENFKNDISIGFRYFKNNSCALKEGASDYTPGAGCIDKAGWRQLLKFTSSSVNIGKTDLHFGDVYDPLFIDNNVFEYDPCHLHFHFQHYGSYGFGPIPGRKVGFCLQTTWRYHNNEWTDFSTPYDSCAYQGISRGWGDDYWAGLDCQWIDVTGLKPGLYNLTEHLNNDGFLCEGVPIYYPNGTLIFIPTNFTNSKNEPESRGACNYLSGYDVNNLSVEPVNFTGIDSMVTLPCRRISEISPTKDCGFQLQFDNLTCIPGQMTSLKLTKDNTNTNAIVRICETSVELGHSTLCEYMFALANDLLTGNVKNVKFMCPNMRSSVEPGGRYSILASTLIPGTPIPQISII